MDLKTVFSAVLFIAPISAQAAGCVDTPPDPNAVIVSTSPQLSVQLTSTCPLGGKIVQSVTWIDKDPIAVAAGDDADGAR